MHRYHHASLTRFMRACLFCIAIQPGASLLAAPFASTIGQESAHIELREQIRQQERERAIQQQNATDTTIQLTRPAIILPDYPAPESPCFTIHRIQLSGEQADQFHWALSAVSNAKGRCLGAQGVSLIISKVQNAILAKGYVTTRVMAQEQDLTQGLLTLTLQPGRVADIRFSGPVSYRARIWNAVPVRQKDLLNLRDIEQALENFKRIPSVEADIQIIPGAQEATSDLQINWQEGRPLRLSLGLDDSGSRSTGRYQSAVTLAIDAPFALNDLFYVSSGRSLFRNGPYDSRSQTLSYLVPAGYWLFSASYSDYNYYQNIANMDQLLTYSGTSQSTRFSASRLLYRDQSNKTTLSMHLWRRQSDNAVNDIALEQQRRSTAGWELGLNQHIRAGNALIDAGINWRRGTAAFGALPAPEEALNGGSARTGIATADISLNLPLNDNWRYFTTLRGQWSRHPLTPQDRLAMAGRYTVRGFDGEQSLSGEKGIIWRNELAWNVLSSGQELYLGIDYGQVEGPGTRYLAGHQLTGSVLGLRGSLWHSLSYELFAGVPLNKPDNFQTSGVAGGFSINLHI